MPILFHHPDDGRGPYLVETALSQRGLDETVVRRVAIDDPDACARSLDTLPRLRVATVCLGPKLLEAPFVHEVLLPRLRAGRRDGQLLLRWMRIGRTIVDNPGFEDIPSLLDPLDGWGEGTALLAAGALDALVNALPTPYAVRADLGHLPPPTDPFVGRARLLSQLEAAGANPRVRVIAIIGPPGVGKSAALRTWLGQSRRLGNDLPVIAGRFDGRVITSADGMLDAVLRGYPSPDVDPGSDAVDRGIRLAARLEAHPARLVLDGIDNLLHADRARRGILTEPGLRALFRLQLASPPGPGQLVVTARRLPTILAAAPAGQVAVFEVAPLPNEDARLLLHARGLTRRTSVDLIGDGQPLALQLRASLMLAADAGHTAMVAQSRLDALIHAWQLRLNADARRLFDVLALVDPADLQDLAVRAELSPAQLRWACDRLQWAQLVQRDDGGAPVLHSSIRQRVVAIQAADDPGGLTERHFRLATHLTAAPALRRPRRRAAAAADRTDDAAAPALDSLLPLYRAAIHAVRGGAIEDAFSAIYQARIQGGAGRVTLLRRGAFGAELETLTAFFTAPWTTPHPALAPPARAWLLTSVGMVLRVLGRIDEARAPLARALAHLCPSALRADVRWPDGIDPAAIAAGAEDRAADVDAAARVACALSELTLLCGRPVEAEALAASAVALADRTGDAAQAIACRSALADAMHHAGRHSDAAALLLACELSHAARTPGAAVQLEGLDALRLADLLLDRWLQTPHGDAPARAQLRAGCDAVIRRTAQAVARRQRADAASDAATGPSLHEGLERLARGRARAALAWLDGDASTARDAAADLDRAVTVFEQRGAAEFIARARIARAAFRRIDAPVADPHALHAANDAALRDLIDALDLANRGGMALLTCDAQLEQARVELSRPAYRVGTVRRAVAAARPTIVEHGYRRRVAELATLDAWLDDGSP
ncbi:MAG: ATP-binding protein [Acidobacteriota bacterium]